MVIEATIGNVTSAMHVSQYRLEVRQNSGSRIGIRQPGVDRLTAESVAIPTSWVTVTAKMFDIALHLAEAGYPTEALCAAYTAQMTNYGNLDGKEFRIVAETVTTLDAIAIQKLSSSVAKVL